jgi:hypothetical protein
MSIANNRTQKATNIAARKRLARVQLAGVLAPSESMLENPKSAKSEVRRIYEN